MEPSGDVLLCFPGRVQTGKLSEFMTTSCCAHLSFMDPKPIGKMLHQDYDDDDDVLDAVESLHAFHFADHGKDEIRIHFNNITFSALVMSHSKITISLQSQ